MEQQSQELTSSLVRFLYSCDAASNITVKLEVEA